MISLRQDEGACLLEARLTNYMRHDGASQLHVTSLRPDMEESQADQMELMLQMKHKYRVVINFCHKMYTSSYLRPP